MLAGLPGLLVGLALVAAQPLVDAVAQALRALARLAVDVPEAVDVVLARPVGVALQVALAAARVVAAEDAVVVAAAHPVGQLADAAHGVGMRSLPLGEGA